MQLHVMVSSRWQASKEDNKKIQWYTMPEHISYIFIIITTTTIIIIVK
jgi:hypothetical protein